MKLSELEIKLLLKIPLTYDILYGAMIANNVGSDERRNQIMREADRIRDIQGK